MRFRCERDTLADAFAQAGRAVTNRAGLPILSALHLNVSGNVLTAIGSDQDMTVRVECPVQGEREGATAVPSRLLNEYVRTLPPGVVTATATDDDQFEIGSGAALSRVRCYPVGEYPPVGERCTDAGVRLPAADFAVAVGQVAVAASRDEARPILTGVLLTTSPTGLRLVATDVYRLALRELPGVSIGDTPKALVPARALTEVERFSGEGELRIVLREREVVFIAAGVQLTSRLIEGEFPNYEQLLPDRYPNRLHVDRAKFLESLNRVKLLAQNNAPVRLRLSSDGMQLNASTQDVGTASDEVEAKYEGEEMTIAFNPAYLSQGLDAAGGTHVVMETLDPLRPVVLRPAESSDYLYLLMPVRI